jgi:hydrogenase expression/formation protein HypD
MTTAVEWLERIRALPLPPSIKVMNVCGGHERSITSAGLRKAIPSNIELVPAPAARSASARKRTSTRRSSSRCTRA